MEEVKLIRLKTVGSENHAVLVISDSWLYAKKLENGILLYKKASLLPHTINQAKKEGYAFLVVETEKRKFVVPFEDIRRVFFDTGELISIEGKEEEDRIRRLTE